MSIAATIDEPGFIKGILRRADRTRQPSAPAQVYERGIQDYADDIQNAMRRVQMKKDELSQAEEQLKTATENFIEQCRLMKLPIEMSVLTVGNDGVPRTYKFED